MMKIAVIGDSHAMFWTGINVLQSNRTAFAGVDVFHVGPATAHNLAPASGEVSRYMRHIETTFGRQRQIYGATILCFGEIDCRVHIVKAALTKRTSISDAVHRTTTNYMRFVDWLARTYDIPIVLWGPGPSSGLALTHTDADYPRTGTNLERNYATHLFNENLRREAENRRRIGYGSIFQRLIEHNGTTRADAHFDNCHVDARHLADALPVLKAALADAEAPDLSHALERRWLISDTPSRWNLATRLVPATTGRVTEGTVGLLPDQPKGQFSFVLEGPPIPSLTLDLRAAFMLSRIVVHGEWSGGPDKSQSLKYECGNSLGRMEPVAYTQSAGATVASASPQLVDMSARSVPTRFVRISLSVPGKLAIDTIQVLGDLFATALIR